jgi:hypothetical protein
MVRGFHPEGTNIKRHARLPLLAAKAEDDMSNYE